MKSYSSLLVLAVACLEPVCTSQSQMPVTPSNGYEILERVAQRYANASSYHIRATNEYVTWNKFQRNWEKKIWDAAEGPGNRFRYEGESGYGHGIRVSDGKEVWSFHVEENAYTKTSSSRSDVAPHGPRPLIEIAILEAAGLRSVLRTWGKCTNQQLASPMWKLRSMENVFLVTVYNSRVPTKGESEPMSWRNGLSGSTR